MPSKPPTEWAIFRAACRIARELMAQRAWKGVLGARKWSPYLCQRASHPAVQKQPSSVETNPEPLWRVGRQPGHPEALSPVGRPLHAEATCRPSRCFSCCRATGQWRYHAVAAAKCAGAQTQVPRLNRTYLKKPQDFHHLAGVAGARIATSSQAAPCPCDCVFAVP